MSTQDSPSNKTDSQKSFAQLTEERFFAGDHVGTVRHFEGVNLTQVVPVIKGILGSRSLNYEDATEEIGGRLVYTNVASFSPRTNMNLWITAAGVESVGVVVDAKLYHSTELSAEADEYLARLVEEMEQKVLKR